MHLKYATAKESILHTFTSDNLSRDWLFDPCVRDENRDLITEAGIFRYKNDGMLKEKSYVCRKEEFYDIGIVVEIYE